MTYTVGKNFDSEFGSLETVIRFNLILKIFLEIYP